MILCQGQLRKNNSQQLEEVSIAVLANYLLLHRKLLEVHFMVKVLHKVRLLESLEEEAQVQEVTNQQLLLRHKKLK